MSRPQNQVTRDYFDAIRRGVEIRTPLENVTHFQAEDKYVTAYTKTNGEFILDVPLWLIERILHQVATSTHRSYLVMNHALAGAKMFKPAGADQWVMEVMGTVPSPNLGGAHGMQGRIIRVARREAKRVRALWMKAHA